MSNPFDLHPLFADSTLWGLFNVDLQTRGLFPRWVAVALGLAAVAAVGVLYAKEVGRLSPARRIALAAVRIAAVVLVAFLMLRPVVVVERKGDRPRPVAVLVDVSQSMGSADPRPNLDDQWRAALAFGYIDPDKPFPNQPISSIVGDAKAIDKPQRIELVRKVLENPKLDLLNRLRVTGPLEVYTFGDTRQGQDSLSAEWVRELSAGRPHTALADSALELLNRDDDELPAAIVLVTDGRENASAKSLAELAAKCRAKSVPLHVYGVGSTAFGQLRLRDVGVPENVFLEDAVSIPVRYAVRGVAEGKVDITLKFGDREVPEAAKLNIPVREGDNLRETLTFVPTKEDAESKRQEVTVEIRVTPTGPGGGVTTETLRDFVTKPTHVVTKKLKVLVVDGLPRVDFKFLQRALLRDRRVDAQFFLTEGDREAMKSGHPWLPEFTRQLSGTLNIDREEFRKLVNQYDLLILGDVPGNFFSPDQQQVIKDFVAEGGGLVHVAGKWNAPRGWLGYEEGRPSVADVLPVELKPEKYALDPPGGRYYQPFVPVVAAGAARNPLVALEDDPQDNSELWGRLNRVNPDDPVQPNRAPRVDGKEQLPPMEWYYPVTRLKPGAEVFLVHPTARTPEPENKPMPLLVGHYYGKGYVLFSAFDDTWRWRFNEADKYFGRFWSQCVYQAGVPRLVGTKRTQLSLDTPEPVQGGSGQLYARILDENFKPLKADEVEAKLERVDANENDKDKQVTVRLHKLDGQEGEYVAPVPFNHEGRYKLTVDPKNASPASLEYRVNLPPNHERALGGMAEAEMRKLAADSGSKESPGKFYHEEDLHKLPGDVAAKSAPYSRRDEVLLWNWWAMGALVALLSLEWFLRKFNGLS